MTEFVDRRILGAVRIVDRAVGHAVRRPLEISSPQARFVRNRSGHYVVTEADGFEEYTRSFEAAPAAPPPLSTPIAAEVQDPLGRYLPRSFTMRLPRDPDPANAESATSVFRPHEATLYPASTMPIIGNWSTVRASVTVARDDDGPPDPARGALLRVLRQADDEVIASGIADERGEALVIVPGVPLTRFGDDDGDGNGPVIVADLPATLEISFSAGRTWPVDPDVLESEHAASIRTTVDLTLRTGTMNRVSVELT